MSSPNHPSRHFSTPLFYFALFIALIIVASFGWQAPSFAMPAAQSTMSPVGIGVDIEKYIDVNAKDAEFAKVFQGEDLTFYLEVRNTTDDAPMYVHVVDPRCGLDVTVQSPDGPDSGDLNGDFILDPTEVWTFSCTIPGSNVQVDFTNIAVVETCAVANCTALVFRDDDRMDIDVINPDIYLEKSPRTQTVLANGSAHFDLYVENTGDQTLTNVVLEDLRCTGGPARQSDSVGNNDAVLNVGERWHYTCTITDVGMQDFVNQATVQATDPNQNIVSDIETAEVDVIHPTIDLEKRLETLLVRQGEDATFLIAVDNTGDQPLKNVAVVDAMCAPALTPIPGPLPPSGADGDLNSNNILDPNEIWYYRCTVADVMDDFVNTATVTASDPLNHEVSDEDSTAVDVLSADIDLEKSGPQLVTLGSNVDFVLEVQNTGEAALHHVTVFDPRCRLLPFTTPNDGDTTNVGVLDVNEIWIFRCTVNLALADFTNYARVTADDGAGNVVEDDDILDVRVVNPRIFLEKSPKNANVLQGSNVKFTLNVRNLGDQNLTITEFSDPLCSAPPAYGSGDDGDQILEPGENWQYTCTVTNVQTDFTNVAVVRAVDPNGITVEDDETAKINVVNAFIDLTKSANTPQIFKGQSATFTLKVKNTGTAALGNLDIIDAQCGNSAPWTTHANPTDPSDILIIDPSNDGVLSANEEWTFICTIPNAVADFTNVARVTAREVVTGLAVEDTASASVDVLNPGINVEKTTTTPIVAQGANVTFQIVVQNTGESTLSDIGVTDGLCTGGAPTPIFGGIGTLPATVKWQYECVVPNVQNDFANTVIVQAKDPAGNTVSHSATAHVDVVNPEIDLEKTPENQTILAGANAQFTLRIKNTGDLVLHNVVLTDALCNNGAPVLVSKGDNDAGNLLSPDEVWVYSCTRNSVQADFTNTASVTALDPANKTVSDSEQALVNVIQPNVTLNKRPDAQTVLKGGTATFYLDITNTGDADLTKVTVSDVLCSAAPTLTSGDNNNDNKLNPSETWTYSCVRNNVVEDFTNFASITFADETGNQLTRTDTATVDVINGGIDIEKSADNTTVLKGQSVNFTLNVLNTGEVPLAITEITDPLCDAAPQLVSKGNGDAILDLDETWRYTCTRSNIQSNFTNVAVVKAVDANQNDATDVDDVSINVINPAIDLEKTPEFQAVLQGATAEFILEVRNIGDQVLTDLDLQDAKCTALDFLGGDSNDDRKLQTNEVWRYRCEVTNVTQNFTNSATVSAKDSRGNTVSDNEEAEVEVVDPGIDLQKTANQSTINKGATASFTIIVRNSGDQVLTVTNVSDPLCDAAPVFIGGDTNNDSKLDLTEFWVYTCGKANVQDDFTNTATVTAKDANNITVTSSDTAAIDVINPGIDLEKSALSQTVIKNSTAAFALSVRNTGQADLTNVVVTDALCDIGPDYVTFTGPGNGNVDNILQPGEVWLYNCMVLNVQEDLLNEATVTAKDGLGNPVSDQDQASVKMVDPRMNVALEASSLIVDQGDEVQFTIVLRNTGEEDLQGVTVEADTCIPVYRSGDTNHDQILQTTETWVYDCNLGAVTGTSVTSTVTVTAQDQHGLRVVSQDTVVIQALDPDEEPQRIFFWLPLIDGE